MAKDPNSFDTNIKTLRRTVSDLEKENLALSTSLGNVLNSRGWKLIDKARKTLHLKNKTISSKEIPTKELPAQNIHTTYNSHYEDNIDYSNRGLKPEVKALAFYLPQFHTFKENDEWWGKGFTEWTNTKKSVPRFDGHYQPREPHDDIGYYTLDNADTIKQQVALAKQHGIYGFCFYYYWFSGKKLMEKPIDIFLKNKDIDFPFCLCWANENWTRTWDGLNKNILIEQKYQDTDPEAFIKDLKKYLEDPRYIRINNKPVIMVYAPQSIPDYETTVYRWREAARAYGIGEILIWSKNNIFDHEFKNADFVDAEFDFAPTGCSFDKAIIEQSSEREVFNYAKAVDNRYSQKQYYSHYPVKPFYYSCTMGWDNSARRKKGYCVLSEYSPEKFYSWLRLIIEETKRRFKPEERFIFINAWNEWAEGTYLEPDKKYGYTNINTAAKAIYGLPYDEASYIVLNQKSNKATKNPGRIAVQIHVFYIDVLEELLTNLSYIPYKFDLYISTDTKSKKILIEQTLNRTNINTNLIEIKVTKNVGRDVYPFLYQLNPVFQNYDIIGHFHTKKTINQYFGDNWRKQLYHSLLGSSENIKRIMYLFKDDKIGGIFPTYYYTLRDLGLASNIDNINDLLHKMKLNTISPNEDFIFPASTMFWIRSSSIKPLFKLKLGADNFPEEKGQVDGTIAHAIERLLGIIPKKLGFKTAQIINKVDDEL